MKIGRVKEWVKVFTVLLGLVCFAVLSYAFWAAWFGSEILIRINNYGEAQVEAILFIILIPVISLGSYWLLTGE